MEPTIHPGQHKNLMAVEFETLLSRDPAAVLLDVRTPAEFNASHIPGAINIDMMARHFAGDISKLDKQKTYFVYCLSGGRSGRACQLMAAHGFMVYDLIGGIANWPGNRT